MGRVLGVLTLLLGLQVLINHDPMVLVWYLVRNPLRFLVGSELALLLGQILNHFGTFLLNLGLAILGMRLMRLKSRGIGLKSPNGWGKVAVAVAFGIGIAAIDSWVLARIPDMVSEGGFPNRFWVAPKQEWGMLDSPIIVGQLFFSWFGASICEELIFRGILYSALREFWGFRKAILVSSVLFALSHFNVFDPSLLNFRKFYFSLLCGLLFVMTYEWEKTIWSPISAHLAVNVMNTWFDWYASFPSD